MMTENLPPEVWLRIFRLVSRHDILNICLVNKKFLSIASSAVLWRELAPSKKKLAEKGSCEDFFMIERFKGAHTVKLCGDFMAMHINTRLEKHDFEQTEEMLKNLLEICRVQESVKTMILKNSNLKKVEPDILVQILNKLVTVDLERSRLSETQIIKILESIPSSKTVKSVNISGIIMSSIPPDHFVQVGESLEHFNFSHTLLTKEQSTNLLNGIAKSKIMRTLRLADIKFGLMTLEGDKFGE